MSQFKPSHIVKFRSRIQNALLFYYLFPILVVFIYLGVYFYFSTENLLDRELGKRLTTVSIFAASQIKPYHLSSLQLHDPNNLTATSLKEKLNEIKNKNQIERIYLFDLNNESLLDTDVSFTPGTVYERNSIHRDEIEKATMGLATSSYLFKNQNGQYMKGAFAPVMDNGRTIAVIGVDGNATFFQSLRFLEHKLILSGLFCIMIIVLVSFFLSKRIVNPIQDLVQSAKKIGDGILDDPIQIKATNELGFLGYVLDEMRKKIVERDQELQVMLRGIAHEVRNPLGGIELFSGILAEQVKDEKSKQAVVKIQREVTNLKNLVEEFLNFAKKPSLQIDAIDFQEFVDEIALYFSEQFKNNDIAFKFHTPDVKNFRGDPYHMKRVFLNLISNAIQSMPHGGDLLINASANTHQVKISIQDSGRGIPQENFDKIFDPFFTTNQFGTGLGLSFVQKIVQAHGGTVMVDSELNKGTKMTITLPNV